MSDNDLMADLADAFDTVSEAEVSDVSEQTETVEAVDEPSTDEAVAEVEAVESSTEGDELTEEEIAAALKEIEEQEAQEVGLQAPNDWNADDKALWEKLAEANPELAPQLQEILARRAKEQNDAFYKKTNELADERKQFEAYKPVQDMFSQYGIMNPAETIQGWANIAINLQNNPAGTLQTLANQYGVDLGQPAGDNVQNDVVLQLNSRIQQLESQFVQGQQHAQTQQEQETLARIDAFANEVNEAGELVNPYFSEVEADMTRLASGYTANSEPVPELSKLYEQATRTNPDVSAKIQAADKAQLERRQRAEAIAKAKRAKLAGKSVESGSGNVVTDTESSLRGELEKAFR